MDGMSGKVVMLALLVSIAIFMTSSASSYIRSWQAKDAANSPVTHGPLRYHPGVGRVFDIDAFYETSEVAKFAAEHEQEILDARAHRKRECGTLVGVSAVDCKLCALFVSGTRDLIEKGSTQADIVTFATITCTELKIEDDRVCKAVVQEFKVSSCCVRALQSNCSVSFTYLETAVYI